MYRVLYRALSFCTLMMVSTLALSATDMPAPHPKWSEKSRMQYSAMDRPVLQEMIQTYFTKHPQYLAKADRLSLETLFTKQSDKPPTFSGFVYNLRVVPVEAKTPDVRDRSWVQLVKSPDEFKRSWDFVTPDDVLNARKDAKDEEERFNQGIFLTAAVSSLTLGHLEAKYMSLLGLEGGPFVGLSLESPDPKRVTTQMAFSVKSRKPLTFNVTFLAR